MVVVVVAQQGPLELERPVEIVAVAAVLAAAAIAAEVPAPLLQAIQV